MAPHANDHETYYPAPFPEDLPTIQLKTIPLQTLHNPDDNLARHLFDILCNEGFFYVDLNQDAEGQEFIKYSEQLHAAAKDVFNNVPVATKEEYRGDPLKGVLDTGYRAMGKDEKGEVRVSEVLNVPAYELLNEPDFPQRLPPWLGKYGDAYRGFAQHGHKIAQLLFATLERSLHLETGTLTSMHELSAATGGFVRMFRLPAPPASTVERDPSTPAHTDGNSMTILFNWQGGLQISRPSALSGSREVKMLDDFSRAQDEWLWVEPKPGHVIVNLGDPMVVLSNGLLASGRHRVVTPPGKQATHDRYSVLVGVRPQSETLMRALKSDVIPPETEEQKAKERVTALEYAINKVRAIMQKTDQSRK